MQRKNDPIISIQIHPKILEHIDCHSRDQYSTRSETVRKILHQWCRATKNEIKEPPVFQY
jgi:metal-responsive CopG/Arc/MetJ family transcriptional regulator